MARREGYGAHASGLKRPEPRPLALSNATWKARIRITERKGVNATYVPSALIARFEGALQIRSGTKTSDVPHGRNTEESAIFSAELRRAFVADTAAHQRCIKCL